MQKTVTALIMVFLGISALKAENGKHVFETYCWGCHHQTAVAFGPPFSEIASHRSAEEIQAMITDPESVSRQFGYKRNAMPAFTLNTEELEAITAYILSFKPHRTLPAEPHKNTRRNMATNKDLQ